MREEPVECALWGTGFGLRVQERGLGWRDRSRVRQHETVMEARTKGGTSQGSCGEQRPREGGGLPEDKWPGK